MTDNNEDVVIDLAEIMNNENIEVNSDVVAEEPKKSKYEDEARAQGWKSKEELEAEGVDPDEFVSAKEYVRYGKLKETTNERIERIEREAEESKRALNTFYERKRQEDMAQLEALKAAQREAVAYAETDKFDAYQKQIDHIQQNQVPQVDTIDPALKEWNEKNSWVTDMSNPKSIDAHSIYNGLKSTLPHLSERERLKMVDDRLNKLYPSTNPMRDTPTQSETGSRPVTRTQGKLSWGDLSSSELNDWDRFSDMYMKPDGSYDKTRFLKVIADDRKSRR